jgi:hypothetical protein
MSPAMSDIEQRLREAMDGVTPGPWVAKQTVINGNEYGGWWLEGMDLDPEDATRPERLILISGSGGARSYTTRIIDRQIHDDNEANMKWFALCSPDNIGALLDTLASLRSKLEEAEGALERFDYFGSLVEKARQAAAKASVKFPQPNYVTLKIAEEAGEVVRGAVHYAEKRMGWDEVEGEIVQLLAMLIRFVTEGDQINGVIPPASLREADHA